MRFVQARHYTPVSSREINLLVIHDMEFPEKPEAAEDVAKFFAGSNAPQASAHYCLDNNSVVQCVRDHDVAWAAPGANNDGLHFEFAGYAAQSGKQWRDRYDMDMLTIAAHLFARKAHRYHIPLHSVGPKGLRAGHSGITTHRFITESGIGGSAGTHQDPGPNFPLEDFVDSVRMVYRILYG